MRQYSYRAIDRQGKNAAGEMTAASVDLVVNDLKKKGLIPINITKSQTGIVTLLNKPLFQSRVLRTKDLLNFTRELATLVGAGLTLIKSLSILLNMKQSKRNQEMIQNLHRHISEGDSFRDALSREGGKFPKFYISMIGAGEASGTLAEVLENLSAYLERSHDVREKIKSALIYPTILVLMVVFAMVLIVTVIIPQFEPIFDQAYDKLPWITVVVMNFSHVMTNYGFLIAILLAVTSLGGVAALQNTTIKKKTDQKILNVFLVGTLIRKAEFARFHRMLGTLTLNGLPLVSAFGIAISGVNNSYIEQIINDIFKRVKEGASLSGEYLRTDIAPPLVTELTRVGEDTGKLGDMLIRTADVMEKDVTNVVDKLMALLVPGLTIIMGFIIAGMIASVLLGIMSINELAF